MGRAHEAPARRSGREVTVGNARRRIAWLLEVRLEERDLSGTSPAVVTVVRFRHDICRERVGGDGAPRGVPRRDSRSVERPRHHPHLSRDGMPGSVEQRAGGCKRSSPRRLQGQHRADLVAASGQIGGDRIAERVLLADGGNEIAAFEEFVPRVDEDQGRLRRRLEARDRVGLGPIDGGADEARPFLRRGIEPHWREDSGKLLEVLRARIPADGGHWNRRQRGMPKGLRPAARDGSAGRC